MMSGSSSVKCTGGSCVLLRLIMLNVAYSAIAHEFLHCDKMQRGVKRENQRLERIRWPCTSYNHTSSLWLTLHPVVWCSHVYGKRPTSFWTASLVLYNQLTHCDREATDLCMVELKLVQTDCSRGWLFCSPFLLMLVPSKLLLWKRAILPLNSASGSMSLLECVFICSAVFSS